MTNSFLQKVFWKMVCIGAEMVIKNGTFETEADDTARSQMK